MSDSKERLGTTLWSARRDGSVLRIVGDLDVFTADDVEERLVVEVLDGIDEVDLSKVGFFGLAGVRVLRNGAEAARAQGTVLHVVCPAAVLRLLEDCGVAEEEVWRLSRSA
jgi:anti-anti-sigma factor